MHHQRLALSATLVVVGLTLTALIAVPKSGRATHFAMKPTSTASDSLSGVNGIWVGHWKADGEPGEGKSLMCETVQVGEHSWKATFNAVCDKDYAFTMEVPGRREGDKVLFEATVDLGPLFGGEYRWSGQTKGDEFCGEYSHTKYNGTFTMTRSADGVIDQGVYCRVPPQPVPETD